MKIIVDFDDVLFKTKALKNHFFRILHNHDIAQVEELYEEERKKDLPFSLKVFLEQVCYGFGDNFVVDIYEEIMVACKGMVNQELLHLLESVGYENCYIVTNGDEAFQKDKIFRAGIDKLIPRIIVVPGSKKKEVEKICKQFPEEKILFIDDKNKFFADIDMNLCTNLTTILYNEDGVAKTKVAIEEGLDKEIT